MLRTFFTIGIFAAPSLAFGGPLEEAPYTVVAEHEGWQERDYPQTRWVSTDFVDIFAHDGVQHREAFDKLFQFISGKNSESVEIPMTAPVTFRIIPGEGPNCSSSVTMSFLVPSFLQESTPQPTDTSVYLEDRPAMRFLTREFGGFPDELDWTIQAAELFELATAAGLQPKSEPHWTAGYDGPSVIVNRRNEVWLELEATV